MMKAGLLCLAGLSATAIAQPHRHQHHEAKRDVKVVTSTFVAWATAPGAVVYVDTDGNTLSTWYPGHAAPTQYSAVQSSSSSSVYTPPATTSAASSYVTPAASSTTTKSVAPASVASTTSSAAAAATSASSGSTSDNSGYTISYSPYNSDNSCKTQAQVNTDFESITGYDMVRIYGTDCNQFATVLSAASAKGMKLFAGIYDITQVASEVQTIISAASGKWDSVHTVSIGNEGVNNGLYSVSDVVAAIGVARTALKAAGYTGSVVTVDTFVAIIANPGRCDASDYVAANCHAFFDGSVTAENAGEFVLGQAQRVSAACGGKDTMITETGWPSQGSTNGKAVPSPENQVAAIKSLRAAFSNNIVLFTAFNDMWKTNNAGTYGAEQYWGIMGNAPS